MLKTLAITLALAMSVLTMGIMTVRAQSPSPTPSASPMMEDTTPQGAPNTGSGYLAR